MDTALAVLLLVGVPHLVVALGVAVTYLVYRWYYPCGGWGQSVL
jgi:hypothetical protein